MYLETLLETCNRGVLFTGNVDKVKSAFNAVKLEEKIGEDENDELIRFADTFVSCSKTSTEVKEIVQEVNIHHHTASCRRYDKPCRFNFPRFPVLKTMLSIPARIAYPDENERRNEMKKRKEILVSVKNVLEDSETMNSINKFKSRELKKIQAAKDSFNYLQILSQSSEKSVSLKRSKILGLKQFFSWKTKEKTLTLKEINEVIEKAHILISEMEYAEHEILSKRLLFVLQMSEFCEVDESDTLFQMYENALKISEHGYSIHHKRSTEELYVNNYNTEWLHNWNANMDFNYVLIIMQ